jgi:diguanylate cyclase (GGDEF)-like protein
MAGPDSVSELLTDREASLRETWQCLVARFLGRLNDSLGRPELFDEVKGLLLELLELVERPVDAPDLSETQIKPIVQQLQARQDRDQLGATETALLLFSVKDILQQTLAAVSIPGEHRASNPAHASALGQVCSLLHRLALVQLETGIGARHEHGVGQDVLAMEYALLYERTRQIAITDQLTGLHNFGYFLDRLHEEKARAERYQRLLSLIMFDLDHFKQYNDSHGHLAGNEVLKRIGAILQAEAREVDIVARYGGEELVILLPEATRRDATALANRIRARVWETNFENMASQPLGRLSVSAGVAAYPVDAGDENELVERADQSLYQAKQEGRNRVVAYLPPHRKTLRYQPYREVKSVALVGNFNNWDKDYDYMYRVEGGAYEFVISLNPGVYHYKFVLDGTEWIPDPACPERCPDTLGGDNSLLRVAP